MMKTKHASRGSLLVQMVPSVWVAVATLIALLLLGAFSGTPLFADDDEGIQRGIDADTARYQAWAEFYGAQAEAEGDSIQRSIESHTTRYQAWAELYGAQAQAVAEPSLEREIRSNSAGWLAYGGSAAEESATLPYTDVSLFYAERMRAEARQRSTFAANPELMAARRAYRVSANELALSPELNIARRSYESTSRLAACSPEDDQMATGRRWEAC